MNTTTQELAAVATTDIATLPPAARAAVVLKSEETRAKLVELVKNSAGIVSVTNKDGREEAHGAAMVLKNTRVAIEKTGKAAREDATAFSKAVIKEEAALIALIEPEEERILALRDKFDAEEKARKDALIAAERARVEAIQGRIEAIRRAPLAVVGHSSAAILVTMELVRDTVIDDAFAELKDQAMAVRSESFNALETAYQRAVETEEAARAAEAARLAEIARIEAERAELARLRAEQAERERIAKIESDRIAAEQAAEAARLEEARREQEAELQRQRDAEAARARAEQEARDAEAAEQRRQIAAQQAQLAEQQAAFAREQAEAQARAQAAIQLERDHAEALEINARGHYFSTTTFRDDGKPIRCNPNGTRSIFCDLDEGADDEAERARLQELADQQLLDARERTNDERAAGLPAGALSPEALEDFDDGPSDDEIIADIIMRMADEYGMTRSEAIERLVMIDFTKLREAA